MTNVDLTWRNERINGHSVSILKSALQKYVRRNNLSDGLMVLCILDNVKDTMGPRAKAIRTNVTNRMIACMTEEVNIHELGLPTMIWEIYRNWQRERSIDQWIAMFTLLVNSRKCRLVSDYKTYYNLPPYKKGTPEKIHQQLLKNHGADRSTKFNYTIDEFKECLKMKNHDVFSVLKHLLDQKFSEKSLWDAVTAAASHKTSNDVGALRQIYKAMTHNEKPIYMYHAILLVLYQDDSRLNSSKFLEKTVSDEELAAAKRAASKFKGPFPDYVLDVHTGSRTKTVLDFALEGAYIPDEDTRFLDEKKREMYQDFKRLQIAT